MTSRINLRPIFHVNGLLLLGLSAFMMIPAIVEALMAGYSPTEFLLSAAVTAFAGALFVLSTRDNNSFSINLKQAFLLTASCWIILPIFAALPLLGSGLHGGMDLSYTDAIFETVSGITTTGSTVMSDLDHMMPGILLWRSLMNWIGGIGIIVMAIILLPFLRIGGMQLFRTESSDRSEKVIPKSAELVKWITGVYVGLTMLCTIAFYISGMGWFDAVNHALATLATGGYSTHDASFGYFGTASQWVAILFMLAGAVPFIAFIKFIKGQRQALFRDPQIIALFRFLAAVIFVAACLLTLNSELGFFDALTATAFNIVSIVTTTGFASTDYTLWGSSAVIGFFLLTFVGGCAGSTSGAIKIYRFQVLWVTLVEQMRQLMSPNRIVILRYHNTRMEPELPVSVLAFLAAFFASIAVVALLLTGLGVDFVTALSASTTAITNVGPGLGSLIGPAGNFAALPDGAKWILSFAMLLGRLEIFTLLMLFDPHFWQD